MLEKSFTSFDGTPLHLYVFNDVQNPKGVVQIAHGMQEYSKTYFKFAEYLQKKGFFVVMLDERAHGKTAGSVENLGQVGDDKNLFMSIVHDEVFLSEMIKQKSDLPLVFFGHSYGSFIGQRYIQETHLYDKVILSGSSFMKTPLIFFGSIIASLCQLIKGKTAEAKPIEKMSFKSYAKHFHDGCWITSDEDETKAFYDDKFNGTPFSYGFYTNMFKNQLKLYKKANLAKIDKKKPILLMSGDKDPVGEFSKGTKKLFKCYQKLGLNVKLKLYPNGRHGMIQERNRVQVFSDVLSFIENN